MEGQASDLSGLFTLLLGTVSMIVMMIAIIIFAFLFQRKMLIKQKAYNEIENLLKQQELKATYAWMQGQEEERKRIAQDLHDSLGSTLSTVRMYSDLLLERNPAGDLHELASKISKLSADAATESRKIAHDLGAGVLTNFGLATAISELCEALEQRRLAVKSFINIPVTLPGELGINAYRIIQELVTNTLKHAQAKTIRLEVSVVNQEYLSIIFQDDGKGFDVSAVQRGMGLNNLKARTDRFSGTLTIDSNPSIGTTIIIELPLANHATR